MVRVRVSVTLGVHTLVLTSSPMRWCTQRSPAENTVSGHSSSYVRGGVWVSLDSAQLKGNLSNGLHWAEKVLRDGLRFDLEHLSITVLLYDYSLKTSAYDNENEVDQSIHEGRTWEGINERFRGHACGLSRRWLGRVYRHSGLGLGFGKDLGWLRVRVRVRIRTQGGVRVVLELFRIV